MRFIATTLSVKHHFYIYIFTASHAYMLTLHLFHSFAPTNCCGTLRRTVACVCTASNASFFLLLLIHVIGLSVFCAITFLHLPLFDMLHTLGSTKRRTHVFAYRVVYATVGSVGAM